MPKFIEESSNDWTFSMCGHAIVSFKKVQVCCKTSDHSIVLKVFPLDFQKQFLKDLKQVKFFLLTQPITFFSKIQGFTL